MKPTSLARRWFLWNAAAWLTGFVVYTPIAHGVTGGHPDGLTPRQIAAHSIALAVVAVIVASAQRRALRPDVSVSLARVLVAVVVFNIAFWIGSYEPFKIDWDMDILFGFLALGSAVWLGTVPATGHRVAAMIALLSFPAASVIAELGLVITASLLRINPDLQTSILQHSIFWITVGGVSGGLGGWVSVSLSRGWSRHHQFDTAQPNKGLQPTPLRGAAEA